VGKEITICCNRGLKVLRIKNEEMKNPNRVLEKIEMYL